MAFTTLTNHSRFRRTTLWLLSATRLLHFNLLQYLWKRCRAERVAAAGVRLCVLTLRRIFPSSPPMSLRALTREIGKHNYSAAQSALLTAEAPSNMQIQTPCLDGDDENKIKTHAFASGWRRQLLLLRHCLECYFFPCMGTEPST